MMIINKVSQLEEPEKLFVLSFLERCAESVTEHETNYQTFLMDLINFI